jgi:hypothetical protein
MKQDPEILKSVFYSQINFWIGTLLLLTVALGGSLVIWHAATGLNPISDAMASEITALKN